MTPLRALGRGRVFRWDWGRVPGTVPGYLPTQTYFSPQQRELLYRWGNGGLKRSRGLPGAAELANGRARISSAVHLGLRCELALSFRVVGGSGSCPREFFGAGGRSLRDLQRRWTACTCSSSGPSPPPSLCSCPSQLPEVLPPPGTEAGPAPEYHVTQHSHLPGSCFPSGKQIHNV